MPSTSLTDFARKRLRAPANAAVATGDVPGVVTLVWQGGRPLDLHAAGVADVESRRPMTYSAIFPLASMTKPVTVVAGLRLLEQGVVRLEDPIAQWAPEFAEMQVLKRSDGPLDETYPAPRQITIEDLMTHRSGLTYGPIARGPIASELLKTLGFGIESALSPDDWMRALAGLPLVCAPGERFEYGHSTDVLGFVLARAAGCTPQELLRQEVFGPLGMADTAFWVSPEQRGRFVANAMSSEPGQFIPAAFGCYTATEPPAYASGGQGLVSTAEDYLAFARMLVRGGETPEGSFLKPETVRLMATNRLTTEQRKLPFMGRPFFERLGFGLGVSEVMEKLPTAGVGAFGWPGGFGGWWQADPANDLVAIWLQACTPMPPQEGPPARMPGAAAVMEFQRAVYAVI